MMIEMGRNTARDVFASNRTNKLPLTVVRAWNDSTEQPRDVLHDAKVIKEWQDVAIFAACAFSAVTLIVLSLGVRSVLIFFLPIALVVGVTLSAIIFPLTIRFRSETAGFGYNFWRLVELVERTPKGLSRMDKVAIQRLVEESLIERVDEFLSAEEALRRYIELHAPDEFARQKQDTRDATKKIFELSFQAAERFGYTKGRSWGWYFDEAKLRRKSSHNSAAA